MKFNNRFAMLIICFVTFFASVLDAQTAYSDEVYRIEVSKDYNGYSKDDLKRRVWELERAVWQLQQKVFQIESQAKTTPTWLCKIAAMGETFSGVGVNRVLAEKEAMDMCKLSGASKKGFFCSAAECSNK
jgi:hypothetical protein